MTRFGVDLVHVRQHVPCLTLTKAGALCKAMTNYVCADCGAGVCGRHSEAPHPHRSADDE